MHWFTGGISIAAFGLAAACSLGQAEIQTAVATTAHGNFRTITLEPRRIVYLEHKGPYWRIGSLLTQLSEYMDRNGLQGPAMVRWNLQSEMHDGFVPRCHVGCAVGRDHVPVAPFLDEILAPETVLSIPAKAHEDGSPWFLMQAYKEMTFDRFKATGTITEVYRLLPRQKGELPGLLLEEIQVSYVEAPPPAPVVEKVPERGLKRAEMAYVFTPKTEVSAPQDAEIRLPATVEPGFSLNEFFVEGRIETLVDLVLQLDRDANADLVFWLAQVSGRISAAARGIERLYPGQPVPIASFASAFENRVHALCEKLGFNSCSQLSVREDQRNPDSNWPQRSSLIRDFDRLLGRIAVRAVDPSGCRDELIVLLERMCEQIRTAGPLQQSPTALP